MSVKARLRLITILRIVSCRKELLTYLSVHADRVHEGLHHVVRLTVRILSVFEEVFTCVDGEVEVMLQVIRIGIEYRVAKKNGLVIHIGAPKALSLRSHNLLILLNESNVLAWHWLVGS